MLGDAFCKPASMVLIPAFQLHLRQQILLGLATVGKCKCPPCTVCVVFDVFATPASLPRLRDPLARSLSSMRD